ncbi:50S ribosomal protein L21 [Ectothiorhodospiraceae bacterium BW-2]|nr:50S ribosomal protein L21 [Ectothiorhodospiraceae bacterium BW-2]
MYAIIKSGGKQYRVTEGQKLRVEKLEAEIGSEVEIPEVLMIGNGEEIKVGAPYLAQSKVTATVSGHGREKKINILKFRRRKHHMKRMGHRQYFTELQITAING